MFKEFSSFMREKGVIGLAAGLVIGAAVTKIVGKLVEDFVSPVISWVTGAAGNLASLAYQVPGTQIVFKWGDFIMALIDFLAIMIVVYLVFVKSPLNKLDKKAD